MRLRFTIFTALIILCCAAPVLAQMECSTLADAGLSTLAANCGDMEANTVCYGSDRVQAVFAADAPPITFDNPGDRAFLSQFAEIQTLPANVAEPQWGIAAIRANVPDDDSEVMATLLLMGDGVLRYTRTLATLGASGRMQSFDVTLASDAAPCAETPSMLVLNADADAELMLNGTKIRFVEYL